jgi:prepilin-type N-terminal cleavage/methylation domain-containing protein
MKNRFGFTLIELMITMAILATLTLLTAQSISQAIRAKVSMQDQIDDVSRMRDAVRLIERDINLAYHYRDLEKEIEQLLKKKSTPSTPRVGGLTPPPPPPAMETENRREVPRRDPETHFIGHSDSVNFVTTNNARTVRNARQADFVEIGYSVRDCKSLSKEQKSSKCLWRRLSPFVDLDVEKGGDEVVLLENITEFKLRYIGKGKQDWTADWRTDAQGDGTTKGRFPQAVEVSLTVEKKEKEKNKKYSMQVVTPIHFPNNPEEGVSVQGSSGR